MKCVNPFQIGGGAYGCGQCTPCRVQKRRIWKTRIILESQQFTDNQFLTLTYSDEALPLILSGTSGTILPTLYPRHLQLFLKRLRRDYPTKLRFFAVGEYGDQTFRPHYHVGIFGLQPCRNGLTRTSHTGRRLALACCDTCQLVAKYWGRGDIEVRGLDASKCEYLARYVTKKMTKKEDARLLNRHPEFSRQSRRPGIGKAAMAGLATEITKWFKTDEIVDVPLMLGQGKKTLPLGRYLRNKLRVELGLPEGAPDEVLRQAWVEEVLPLLQMASKDRETLTLREAFRKKNQAYADSLEMRMKLREKGRL